MRLSDCSTRFPPRWSINPALRIADFDGDGKSDASVFRNGTWFINPTTAPSLAPNSFYGVQFGLATDKLAPADYDGDGNADLSVYREGAQSYFYYRASLHNPSGNITYLPWGTTGDKPQRGDFDGDGKLDAAVFRPSNGIWYIRNSADGLIRYDSWGISTDKLISADYDGDGKTDLTTFRNGIWYVKQSSNNQPRYILGIRFRPTRAGGL